MSGTSDHLPEATRAAAAKGLVVVIPKANELFVDIDDAASLAVFNRNVSLMSELLPCTWAIAPSPSGKPHRHHATVTLSRDVSSPFERVMLQALLGSDLLHEVLSWRSATKGVEHPTLFFEKPNAQLPAGPPPPPQLPEYVP